MTRLTGNKGRSGHGNTAGRDTVTSPTESERLNTQETDTRHGWHLVVMLLLGIILGIGLQPLHQAQSPQAQPTQSQSTLAQLTQFEAKMMYEMKNGGCAGINKFLTFTNFTSDLERLRSEYLSKYSTDQTNPFGNNTIFYPPAALTLGLKDLDCKQMALWTLCLANYYPSVSCQIYYLQYDTGLSHVGFECSETIGNSTYYSRT